MVGTASSGNRTPHRYTGPVCGAKTRRGTDCQAPAMSNGRCRVHGGASLKGVDAPAWRTGRWSKYLGQSIAPIVADQMNEALHDRMSMDQELALVDTRIALLLEGLGRKESGVAWGELQGAIGDFDAAQKLGKNGLGKMHEALERIRVLSSEGASESEAWDKVMDLINKRRILVESEERRAVANGKSIPSDQVQNLFAAITNIVMDEIKDKGARRRVNERILALAHGHRLNVNALPQRVLDAGR